ncbi:MAG: hypothetical protein AABX31_00930 [Nanoarchaeota archaeon]
MEAVAQQHSDTGYKVIKANTYAQGVAKLRRTGQQPKTFKENIEALVVAYENGDRQLFNNWFDSCTAVVNKAYSTKFKVIPRSNYLLLIPMAFEESFLSVSYDDVQGTELDSTKGKYNHLLHERDILTHRGWLEAVEKDKALLKTYRDIIFKGFKKEEAMAFYVRQNTAQDELRALFVNYLDDDSYAGGGNFLDNGGSFLLGSPVRGAAGARAGKTGLENTPEELELKVRGILSSFDKYVGSVNETKYLAERYQAERELVALLKK